MRTLFTVTNSKVITEMEPELAILEPASTGQIIQSKIHEKGRENETWKLNWGRKCSWAKTCEFASWLPLSRACVHPSPASFDRLRCYQFGCCCFSFNPFLCVSSFFFHLYDAHTCVLLWAEGVKRTLKLSLHFFHVLRFSRHRGGPKKKKKKNDCVCAWRREK